MFKHLHYWLVCIANIFPPFPIFGTKPFLTSLYIYIHCLPLQHYPHHWSFASSFQKPYLPPKDFSKDQNPILKKGGTSKQLYWSSRRKMVKELKGMQNWGEVAPRDLIITHKKASSLPTLETILEEGSEGFEVFPKGVLVSILPLLLSGVIYIMICREFLWHVYTVHPNALHEIAWRLDMVTTSGAQGNIMCIGL